MPREKFIGQQCASCHTLFNKNDDIVVCPECGTPYHRECYKNEGKCVNVELHEKGLEWQPERREPVVHEFRSPVASEIALSPIAENVVEDTAGESDADKTADGAIGVASYQEEYTKNICPVCGTENHPNDELCHKCGCRLENNRIDNEQVTDKNICPVCKLENRDNDVFCARCGAPLDMERATSHGNSFGIPLLDPKAFRPDSNVDGNTVDEYTRYIGRGLFGFLPKFLAFSKGGSKFSFNIGALFFPGLYFFYRKMNLIGTIVLLISAVLSIPSTIFALVDSNILAVSIVESQSFQLISAFVSIISTILNFACCFLADWLYYQKAKSDIQKIKNTVFDDNAKNIAISQKGGISWTGVLVAATTVVIIASVSMFILTAVLV